MIPLLATTLAVVLGHYLLAGSAIDLGPAARASAPAVLLLAAGWGLVSRIKLPYLADSLALALLVPARGPLCDLVGSVVPLEWGGPHVAALVSLGPIGFALGRQLATLLEGSVLAPLAGWVLGEVAVSLGVVGWLPGWGTGFVVAAAAAAMVEMGDGRRMHSVGGGDEATGWEGAPLGLALGLAFVCLRRVVPGYVTPEVPLTSEIILSLAVPALPVALFASLLVGGAGLRRGLHAAAMLGLCWALWTMTVNLGTFLDTPRLIAMTREYRVIANDGWPLIDEWRLWATFFSGAVAAMAGAALAGLSRRSAGPLAVGMGLGLLAEQWVAVEPVWGVFHLSLAAVGVAGAGCLVTFGPRWLLLAPLAALPFVVFPDEQRTGFDGIRRVGDFSADGWSRSLSTDVALFSSGSKDINSVEGRRAARESFTRRRALLRFDELGRARFRDGLVDPGEDEVPELLAAPDEHDHAHDPDEEDTPVERFFGVRVAGTTMHADEDPMGPEGSCGRLARVLLDPGPALVVGVGAELLAADLADAGWPAGELVAGSRARLSSTSRRVLLDDLGSRHTELVTLADERSAVAAVEPGSRRSVVLTPERQAWPGAGDLLSVTRLSALAETLAEDGRLLAWIDTSDLDQRALAARLAAFGSVFGERAGVFIELRGLDPPLLAVLGWRAQQGRPRATELAARLPTPDRTGFRSRLADWDDLAAMLLLDGAGLAELSPLHDRSRPVAPTPLAEHGAAALVGLLQDDARLARVVDGVPEDLARDGSPVLAGLAQHGRYFYELHRLRGSMTVEPLADVDWSAFDVEVGHYARAVSADPDHPLLLLAVAALLEPLVEEGDMTRFADAFRAVDGESLRSWRLALQHAVALSMSLEEEAAREALERARVLAGVTP